MTYQLTKTDIALCGEFETFLKKIVSSGVIHASVSRSESYSSASAHDIFQAYLGAYKCETIADKLQDALNQHGSGNPSEAKRRATRIMELRSEIEKLEGGAA